MDFRKQEDKPNYKPSSFRETDVFVTAWNREALKVFWHSRNKEFERYYNIRRFWPPNRACNKVYKPNANKLPYWFSTSIPGVEHRSTHKEGTFEQSNTAELAHQHNTKRIKPCISGQSLKIQSLPPTSSASHNPTITSENVILPKIAEVNTSKSTGSPSQR